MTPTQTLADLDTPALLLERGKVTANAARLRAHIEALGSKLRLHVKTAKCLEVTRMVAGDSGPITVSTLKEAEVFASHGYRDILYGVAFAPGKLDRALKIVSSGVELTVVLDSLESARLLAAAMKGKAEKLAVLVEIDCDGHRAGLKPGNPEIVEVARALAGSGADVAGVMTHAGGSYDCRSIAAIRAVAEKERAAVVEAVTALRTAGFEAPVVSVGSTPTATYGENLAGVTEVRAGVFVFFDLVMAGIDVCKVDDIALSVLGTVIGHQREKGWVLTDAGWMAMSRDRGTSKQPVDQGYGIVCDVSGRPIEGLIVSDASQEHGIISHRSGDPARLPELPVGTRLRILPNHACATAAQYDRYSVLDGSDRIADTWERFSGW
ncbi:MAG: DSD1 family PLP-dependent enzyme [Betaproteobacteria bacterium]|nr:DSD1 family PLP-dependent enzyme [Betaproteobacteria bacterium]